MLGILLYLSSAFIGSPILFLVFTICCFRLRKTDFRDSNFMLLGIISILSVSNFFVGILSDTIYYGSSKSILSLFPYAVLLCASYVIAKKLRRDELKILLYLICFEIFVGVVEYAIGVPSLFGMSDDLEFGGEEGLLYNKRVAGLSSNSSVLALKCLFGLFLIEILHIKNKFFFIGIILVGFFVTFNRTYLFSAFPILGWIFYVDILKRRVGLAVLIVVLLSILLVPFIPFLFAQFLRGNDLENITYIASGRDIVYQEFWDFFQNHFWRGNSSVKLWMVLRGGDIYHAHSSFLMTLASNGVLISLLYLYVYIKNINKSNWIYGMCMCLASITQYTIGWGLAFPDIICFWVLFCSLDRYSYSKFIHNSKYDSCCCK